MFIFFMFNAFLFSVCVDNKSAVEKVDFQRESERVINAIQGKDPSSHRLSRACKVLNYAPEDDDDDKVTKTWVTKETKSPSIELVEFAKDDWHKSNKYSRGVILSILFVGYDAIISKEMTSVKQKKWTELKEICRGRENLLHNMETVDAIPWSVVKDIINPMFEKYHRDLVKNDLRKFHAMYKDAIIAWRNFATI